MKDKILTLIIGILIGAIIATGVFLILKGNSGGNQMRTPPSMNEDFEKGENFQPKRDRNNIQGDRENMSVNGNEVDSL